MQIVANRDKLHEMSKICFPKKKKKKKKKKKSSIYRLLIIY